MPSLWESLAAPIPAEKIKSRTQKIRGREVTFRYIDAQTVRERLDALVPGRWQLSLRPLPPTEQGDSTVYNLIAELTIIEPPPGTDGNWLPVSREDVGTGYSYKAAASDAFKRAAMRFGIAHELYEEKGKPAAEEQRVRRALQPDIPDDEPLTAANAPDLRFPGGGTVGDDPACPKCGGEMWDNRESKRSPKAPDFRCKDRDCDGVIWPPKQKKPQGAAAKKAKPEPVRTLEDEDDDLPF